MQARRLLLAAAASTEGLGSVRGRDILPVELGEALGNFGAGAEEGDEGSREAQPHDHAHAVVVQLVAVRVGGGAAEHGAAGADEEGEVHRATDVEAAHEPDLAAVVKEPHGEEERPIARCREDADGHPAERPW